MNEFGIKYSGVAMDKNKSHQIKSFFSDQEVSELKETIYKFFNNNNAITIPLETLRENGRPENTLLEQEWSGRALFIASNHIPKSIFEKISKYVKENYGEKLVPEGFAFTRYSNKYGTPRLAPHYDTGHTKFTLDYQIESNVSWKLLVENKEYVLEDNDALVFKPSYEVHWREPKILKDGEYVDMIFFHFHDGSPNEDEKTKEEKKQIESSFQEKYQQEFINVHGWDYWHGNRL